MRILGIETSCDETACAVVENGITEIASSLATSAEIHEKYGGIVPEVAARKQVESIIPVISETLLSWDETLPRLGGDSRSEKKGRSRPRFGGVDYSQKAGAAIDALAVTIGPGLVGSLVVGIEAAKALALAWDKPLIPVNHLVGHIYANWIGTDQNRPAPQLPAVALIASGNHTDLVLMKDHGKLEYIGWTVDDAAGEAFDKVARLLGIKAYYGGRALSEKAATFDTTQSKNLVLPRPMLIEGNFNFSFSGLKTAVKRVTEEGKFPTEEIAYEFEQAVTDVLAKKTLAAVQKYDSRSILLAGGVSANTVLRKKVEEGAKKLSKTLFVPPVRLCTDNAVCIAAAAYFNQTKAPLADIKPDPSLRVAYDAT